MKTKRLLLPVKKQLMKTQADFLRFSLSRKIQTNLEMLQKEEDETMFEVKKLKREYELYKTKNKGIKEIEARFGNQKEHTKDEITQALSAEIQRLMNVVVSQQEIIQKTPFLTSEISQIRKPSLQTSKNPIKLTRNFITFRKELTAYRRAVIQANTAQFEIMLHKNENGVEISRNGSKAYQSEYMKECNSYIQVGEKLKRTYYLADIPAYLSPYVFFRLLTSDLPFTLSMFID